MDKQLPEVDRHSAANDVSCYDDKFLTCLKFVTFSSPNRSRLKRKNLSVSTYTNVLWRSTIFSMVLRSILVHTFMCRKPVKRVILILHIFLLIHPSLSLRICHHVCHHLQIAHSHGDLTRRNSVHFSLTTNDTYHSYEYIRKNDFHARYAEIDQYGDYCNRSELGQHHTCFASIARVKSAMDKENCDLRIHAGDMVQGSIYHIIFGTDLAIDAYNSIGYDFAVLGNHEFNDGPQPVYHTIQNTPGTRWITSNVHFLDAPKRLSTFKSVDSQEICWISALTHVTTSTSNPGDTVVIKNYTHAIMQSIQSCSQQNNVIAITHIGYDEDIRLCHDVREIDLVIGGHSHTNISGRFPTRITRDDGSECLIVTAYHFGLYLGVLDIHFDAGKIKFDDKTSKYLLLDSTVPMDNYLSSKIDWYSNQLEKDSRLINVVASATEDIDGSFESCRSQECAMGNLACDALLAHASRKEGATACILNGGAFRSSLRRGAITGRDILDVFPFGNVHRLINVTGWGLKAVLRSMYSSERPSMVQISNLTLYVDYSTKDDRLKNVLIDGKAIEDEETYLIVTNDYIASNQGGYNWVKWKGDTNPFNYTKVSVSKLVEEYLEKNNPYQPLQNDNRIVNLTILRSDIENRKCSLPDWNFCTCAAKE